MGIQTALKREDCRSVTKNQDEILHTNFVFIGGGGGGGDSFGHNSC